jgi:L-lactate utilization protein LutC
MTQYNTVADDATIKKTKAALEANGFSVTVVENAAAAKEAALADLPQGAEVLTVTSRTAETIGLTAAINESGVYDAVRPKLAALMGDPTKRREQRKLGSAPDYVVGSVHALTQDGHVLIASATGSQLPAYVYGAEHVIWVVGTQKIVRDLDDAWQRLQQHVFPLENERAKQVYGSGSSINKVVTYNKEAVPGRIHIILVKEVLGF